MSTLALDLATVCGYAILRSDGRIESGSEKFNPKTGEGQGARWTRFRAWLVEAKNTHDVDRVAYELVVGGVPGQVYAAQIYGGFVAILQAFCEHHRIPYTGHHVGTIKKAWTGNGAAKKALMVARCKELGFTPRDDNEADAIALLHVELGRVPALPIERQVKKRPLKPNTDKATRGLAFDPF